MLKCSLDVGKLDAFLLKASNLIKEHILKALIDLTNEGVERARNRSEGESWYNQTGNLRSSIGGAVYDHGVIVMQTAFGIVLNGLKGSAEGKRMVQELAHEYENAVCANIIAAMDYADTVEALESKDVLESTRIWMQSVVMERVNKAIEEAEKVINTWSI